MRQSSPHNKSLYPPKISFFCNKKTNKKSKHFNMSDFWAFQWRNSPVSPFLYFKWTLCKWCRCLWCKSEKVQISAQTQICAHLQLWKKFQNISYMRQGKSFFQTMWALFLSATFYMSRAVCVQIWMIENWSRGNRLFYFLIFYWNWCPQSWTLGIFACLQ